MHRMKMGIAAGDFVVFDDDQPGDQGQDAGDVQDSMDVCALDFLFRSVGRLKEEDGLGG